MGHAGHDSLRFTTKEVSRGLQQKKGEPLSSFAPGMGSSRTHGSRWSGTLPQPAYPPEFEQGGGPPLNTWLTIVMMSAEVTFPEQFTSPRETGSGGAALLKT